MRQFINETKTTQFIKKIPMNGCHIFPSLSSIKSKGLRLVKSNYLIPNETKEFYDKTAIVAIDEKCSIKRKNKIPNRKRLDENLALFGTKLENFNLENVAEPYVELVKISENRDSAQSIGIVDSHTKYYGMDAREISSPNVELEVSALGKYGLNKEQYERLPFLPEIFPVLVCDPINAHFWLKDFQTVPFWKDRDLIDLVMKGRNP